MNVGAGLAPPLASSGRASSAPTKNMDRVKHIAIVGANREGLSLLPILLQDKTVKIAMIADSNKDALLFKLDELGYRLAEPLYISVSLNPEDIKNIESLDIIINASENLNMDGFLKQQEFANVEKLSPLSAKLIWGLKETKLEVKDKGANGHAVLLSSLREVVDAIRLTSDRKELLSLILRLAVESTNAEKGSLMLLDRDAGHLRVEIAEGMEEEIVRKIKVPLGSGISGKVAQDGKPLLISGRAEEFSHVRESNVKSALCVPLIISGTIIGVINVNNTEFAHAFTQDDLAFLTRLAALASEVIFRSEEYEDMKMGAVKFGIWKEVDKILGADRPLEKKLHEVCGRLSQFIEGFNCSIYMLNEDTQMLHLKASTLTDTKIAGPFAIRSGEGIESWAANTGKTVVLSEKEPEADEPKKAYIAIPIAADNRVVGLLSGQLVSQKGLLPYQELFLKDVVVPIAEAIDLSQKQERQFLKSNKMIAVDETGLELISITDPDKLSNIVATVAAAIIGAEGSTLRMRQDGAAKFQLQAARGLEDEKMRAALLPLEREVFAEVVKTKKPITKDFPKETNPLIISLLSCPLKMEEKVVGVLTLFNKTAGDAFYPEHFTKTDMEILNRFIIYVEKALLNIMFREEEKAKTQEMLGGILSGREFLQRRAEEEIGRGKRFGKKFLFMIIHIPGLDAYGNQAGDKSKGLIINILDALKNKVRNFDVVAKLDNERLGVLFLESDAGALRLANKLRPDVEDIGVFDKALIKENIAIRCGYAVFPDDGATFDMLMKKASSMIEVTMPANTDRWI